MMRRIGTFGLALLAALVLASTQTPAEEVKGDKLWVYLGTYTGGKAGSKGIYRSELDLKTGKLAEPMLVAETPSPSFVAIHPSGKYLYAVSEVGSFKGKKGGAVRAYAIETGGKLKLLNDQSSGGGGPCHLIVSKSGKFALVANYGGGNASVLPIGPDGKLGEASGFVQHKGKSVSKSRQQAPHAHSINLDASGRFAIVADLGLDKVLIYKLDPKKGTLTPNDPAAYDTAPGAGPRHFAFHPNGRNAYVINELNSTLDALSWDAKTGTLSKLQTLSTLPKSFKGNSTAEVVVHPSGKFVYGSNRGHNSIAVFAVKDGGKLVYVENQKKGISTPRNFVIDPTGKYMLVANQSGNSVIVFNIDQKTGRLMPTDQAIKVGSPVCVRFLAPRE